jgi:uncharacterized coiled-coil DUF342 family protein
MNQKKVMSEKHTIIETLKIWEINKYPVIANNISEKFEAMIAPLRNELAENDLAIQEAKRQIRELRTKTDALTAEYLKRLAAISGASSLIGPVPHPL